MANNLNVTYMQKSLLFLFFLGMVLTARAEWVVVQQDGKAAAVSHADVRRITLTGGDNFNGLATGGTLTGGVTAKTFTASSKVTTIR